MKLFHDCKFDSSQDAPFLGALDIRRMAKERNAVKNAIISLFDLTTVILWQHLPKDPAICVSTDWDRSELPETHINYAILDVYVSWHIFQVLKHQSDSQ